MPDPGSSLKAEQRGFAGRLDEQDERRSDQGGPPGFGLKTWKDEVAIT